MRLYHGSVNISMSTQRPLQSLENLIGEWSASGEVPDAEPRLDRLIPPEPGSLVVPATIDLSREDESWLVYQMIDPSGQHQLELVTPGPTLLEEFLRLHQADDEAILDYARRWGVLGWRAGTDRGVDGGAGLQTQFERVALWRELAARMVALLHVASAAEQGESADKDTLMCAFCSSTLTGSRHTTYVDDQWWRIGDVVNAWLTAGGVKFAFDYEPLRASGRSKPELVIAWSGLFGALAAQFALVITRSPGFVFCSNCGQPYAPRRRPAFNRRNYCPAPACQIEKDRAKRRDWARNHKRGEDGNATT